ncbi:MAG: hypothetical protein PHR15_00455 [Atopobiaceae bacterium]|nr:hypothetical protein [Atopobiaceae bacterium]MCH4181000.1 hypothetical protein [Atopobiaceae bacterium]MCH4214912.1 hypothetical protein [Atopobiaceae bacterium]MCH4229760.1 hypothetical protein [Atopobiaceae bacterium]MCH4276043.1 hypothetical protein [Atopobiaceae bacterium]
MADPTAQDPEKGPASDTDPTPADDASSRLDDLPDFDEGGTEDAEDGSPKRGSFSDTAGKVGSAASQAASSAGKTLNGGLSALREVSRAKKEHGTARAKLDELNKQLEATTAEYDHRREIEDGYDGIIAEQTTESASAQAALDAADADEKRLNTEHDDLSAKLDQMKADHEQKLRPYKNLMESSKSRHDDAQKALTDAKRALKTAEGQSSDAVSRRDSRISAANRAVDNAEGRLHKLQDELDRLQKEPTTTAKELSDMRGEVASELAHLKSAREEVEAATEETKQVVDNAQTHLWTQQQSLSLAEKQAAAAKEESSVRGQEYDKLHEDAMTEEATLDNEVVKREMDLREAHKAQEAAKKRIDAAQALLDEAEDIHSTPERTSGLASEIEETKGTIAQQQSEVDTLAASEKTLRETTRKQRITFVAVIVAVVVVVLLVVWLVTR